MGATEKTAAAWHGVTCDGKCCPRPYGTGPRNPFGTCAHGHACRYHVNRARAEQARQVQAEMVEDMDRRFSLAAKRGAWS